MLAVLTSLSRSTWVSVASVAVAFCTSMALGIVLFDHAPAPAAPTPAAPVPAAAASTPATTAGASPSPAATPVATATAPQAAAPTTTAAPTTPAVAPATIPTTIALDDPEALAKAQVAAQYAKLKVPARKVETPPETAQQLREALRRDDYATATKIAQASLAASKVEGWDFAPFATVVPLVEDLVDPAFQHHLDGWVAATPKSALPLIFRAQYHVDYGWTRRGENMSALVGRDNMQDFDTEMNRAAQDVEAALKIDPRNPTTHVLKLSILHGQGMSQVMVDAFKAAIKQQPDYYPLYSIMLDVLEPKWGGAVENMRKFVAAYAEPAPTNSPLKMLYLELYTHSLSIALDHCQQSVKPQPCIAKAMEELVTPAMKGGLNQALALYDLADPTPAGHYRFGQAVEPIMKHAMMRSAGDFYSGALLQLLASAMHSDTALSDGRMTASPPMPGAMGLPMGAAAVPASTASAATDTGAGKAGAHNDYVIDKLLAHSWYNNGYYANALVKAQDALADIAATDFATEGDRDQALSGVYLRLSEIQSAMMQLPAAVATAEAAEAMGGHSGVEQLACVGYRDMHATGAALAACKSALTRNPNNLTTRYYQALLEDELGQQDAALGDYLPVADTHGGTGNLAVLSITRIYFSRQRNQDALDMLNGHQEMFDPRITGQNILAQAYDNRCNAFLQLGKLKEALADCQLSLQYGNLPEAFRKEQELVQRIGQSKT